jgi:hypothetical protein
VAARRNRRIDDFAQPSYSDCPHVVLAPYWDSIADMGSLGRATRFECTACAETFTLQEAEVLRQSPKDQFSRWVVSDSSNDKSVPSSRFEKAFYAIPGLLVAYGLYALVTLVFTLPDLPDARASSSWPSVPGVVISQKTFQDEVGADAFAKYRYAVGGKTYTSSRIRFMKGVFILNQPHDAESRYAEGKEVEVYYKPTAPEVSVLEPGATSGLNRLYFALLAPALGLVLGVAWMARSAATRS